MFGLDALWWRSHVGDGHVIAPEAQLFALLCPADCTLSHKRDFLCRTCFWPLGRGYVFCVMGVTFMCRRNRGRLHVL